MATQTTPAAEQSAPPRKTGKLILITALSVLALGAGGGGAAWYFLRHDPNAPAEAAAPKPAIFLPLETFTVNLVPQDGQPQYLQAGLTLKLGEQVKSEVIKDRMPEIRDRILMVLSGKKAGDVLSVGGKRKLALEITDAIQHVLGPAGGLKAVAQAAPAEPAPGEAAAAEPAAPAAPEAAKKPPSAAAAPIEVLFTSFIIQ